MSLHITNFSTRWRLVVSFTLRPVYLQRKRPPYPLNRMLSGHQNQFQPFGQKKNLLPLPSVKPILPVFSSQNQSPCHLSYCLEGMITCDSVSKGFYCLFTGDLNSELGECIELPSCKFVTVRGTCCSSGTWFISFGNGIGCSIVTLTKEQHSA